MKRRNKFSLSHYKLLSMDMGELVPCACFEVLPGDTIQMSTSALIRVSPLLSPVMHPVQVRIHHWFVPNRLVWDNWEDFITGGPDGDDTHIIPNSVVVPVEGTLPDYLGLPTDGGLALTTSELPFRAYQMIWNEWYRDQDLQGEVVVQTGDAANGADVYQLRNCNWEKDYFTTSRPWPQKGAGISLPVGGLTGQAPLHFPSLPSSFVDQINQANPVALTTAVGTKTVGWNLNAGATQNKSLSMPSDAYADIAGIQVGAVAINDLREAFALQRYQENRARYGSRFTEYLASLGVRSSDSRLQRPEYLGGGKQTIQFSEVLQHSPEIDATGGSEDVGVGQMRGHGIAAMRSNRFRRFIEEHGYVISLLSVKPKTMYQQGLQRHWFKSIKEDFWQKELEHIGQQEVLNKEVYAKHTTPNGIFGYQDRYDEYRRLESGTAGQFKTTLNFWHYARDFATNVALNSDFVKAVPTKRVNAVTSQDVLWVMCNHSIQARRLLAPVGTSHIF